MEKIPIFFDFGGTIVDNIKVGQISFNTVFNKNLSVDDVKAMYQVMSKKFSLEFFRLPINPFRILLKRKKFLSLQNDLIFQHAKLFPSAAEFLFNLKEREELELVIVTQNPQLKDTEFVDRLFRKLFNSDHPFDYVLSDLDKIKTIKENFSDNQISKSLFIGDLQNDMNIAKKLGVPGIGVAWGYADGKLDAHSIVDNFESLLFLIDNHLSNI